MLAVLCAATLASPVSAAWTAGNVTVVQTTTATNSAGSGLGNSTTPSYAIGVTTSLSQWGQNSPTSATHDRAYGRTYTKGNVNDPDLDVTLTFSVLTEATALGGFNGTGSSAADAEAQSQNHGILAIFSTGTAASNNFVQGVGGYGVGDQVTATINATKRIDVRLYQYSSASSTGTGQGESEGRATSSWSGP